MEQLVMASARIPDQMKDRLDKLAFERDSSFQEIARQAFDQFLDGVSNSSQIELLPDRQRQLVESLITALRRKDYRAKAVISLLEVFSDDWQKESRPPEESRQNAVVIGMAGRAKGSKKVGQND